MMRNAGCKLTAVLFALMLSGGVQAAPPSGAAVEPDYEPVTARVESVNVAGRQLVAGGQTWALSSTVRIQVPGKKTASLRDVSAGERVVLELEPGSSGELPVVRSLTVQSD